MSKQTFNNRFLITLAVVFVPVFAAFRYFESTHAIESFGVWNTDIGGDVVDLYKSRGITDVCDRVETVLVLATKEL